MITIGTRGSELALWQARFVQAMLHERAGLPTEIEVIRTEGDRIVDQSLADLPGKGFFTKEIESALLDGGIDLAVHSYKDLPTTSPPGLVVGANPERRILGSDLLQSRRDLVPVRLQFLDRIAIAA